MKRFIKISFAIAALVIPPICAGQGTLHITFDGPPYQPPGSQFLVQQYFEQGMYFRPIPGTDGFARTWTNMPPGFPINDTPYLQAGAVDSLVFSMQNNSLFGVVSVDLAGFSIGFPNYTVNFVGYRPDGGTLSTSFSGSGIVFQTHHFDPEWSFGLTRVEIPNYPWSLDNLVVSIPEPTASALFAAIMLTFIFCKMQRKLKRLIGRSAVLAALMWPLLCSAQGTLRITFDGPPTVSPGSAVLVQQYFESGMWFRPMGEVDPGNVFGRVGSNPVPGRPDDGTAYLQAGLGSALLFSFENGSLFGLASVDLAEYSTVVPDAATLPFIGYRPDGSTVSTSFTTDGIIDGTGPIADFQTFHFGPEFSGLTRVEIPTSLWSLDNLVVSIPEPAAGALLVIGTLTFLFWRMKRRK